MLGDTNRRLKLFICSSIYASLIFTSQVLGCSQRWELWLLLTGSITLLSGFAHHFAALRTMLWFSRFQITSGGSLRVAYAAHSCRWSGNLIQTNRGGLLNPPVWLLKKFDIKRLRFINTFTSYHSETRLTCELQQHTNGCVLEALARIIDQNFTVAIRGRKPPPRSRAASTWEPKSHSSI
jgi:hypothetical protein